MSYESDPNTRRLATNCVVCGLPLRDADSVELGIGPTCREKCGYSAPAAGPARDLVNRLIHAAGVAAEADDVPAVLRLSNEIEAAGYAGVAGRVRDRFTRIRLRDIPDVDGKGTPCIAVFTPYSEAFLEELRRDVPRGDREFRRDGSDKFWAVAPRHRRTVLRVLSRTFPGAGALGPKGAFVIPTPDEFDAQYANPPAR